MTDLGERFERLGLAQYLDVFIAEGFDSWNTVLDITESDLASLEVRLGHRRKLQRAIAEARGQRPDRALSAGPRKAQSADGLYRSDDSATELRDATGRASHGAATGGTPAANTGTKRKYRRHPKPDQHAPERPPSAYVIFSNQVREELKGQDLSFTDIAKAVGERWQIFPATFRETCEQQANAAKEKYYAELAEYKKTSEFAQYQEYLVEFKAKHGQSRSEGKRSKVESETSSASLAPVASVEHSEMSRSNRSIPSLSAGTPQSSDSSPPSASQLQAQSAFRPPSSSFSPALHSEVVNSPTKSEPYSPRATSLISSVYATKEFRGPVKAGQLEARLRDQNYPHNLPHSQSSYSGYWPAESWLDTGSGQPGFYKALPGRTSRGSSVGQPPSLVHQESTLSSADSVPTLPPPASLLLPIDISKPSRILPTPVIGKIHRSSVMDHRPAPVPFTISRGSLQNAAQEKDGQRTSPWPALLRATKLAREEAMNTSANLKEPTR